MIDKERPIILSEERTRDSVSYREFVASFDFLLPDSLLPRRMPIGLDANIRQARQDRFALYYNHWYRPERMAVIGVVGAVDPGRDHRADPRGFRRTWPPGPPPYPTPTSAA